MGRRTTYRAGEQSRQKKTSLTCVSTRFKISPLVFTVDPLTINSYTPTTNTLASTETHMVKNAVIKDVLALGHPYRA